MILKNLVVDENDYYGNVKYNIILRIFYWIDFVEIVIIIMMYENLFD